jgi:hypothetical protein
MSTTQLSLNKLRKAGYTVSIVEKWVPQTAAGFKGAIIRKDVWGFGDILAVKIGEASVILVQTTSRANISSRLNKIKEIPESGIWLAAGNRIVIHGWSQKKGSTRWICKEVEVAFEEIEAKIPDQQPALAI